MFKKDFKSAGRIELSQFMRTYKVGDIVDIKANSSQQKGMPHKVRLSCLRWSSC